VDDLSGVPQPRLDQRVVDPVSPAFLTAASASASNPGGITGHLLNFSGPAAYALVGFLAFAEAALMVGFFIPGETAVVIGGVLAGLGRVNLGVMIVVVIVCAIVGDSVGFEVGKKAGPWLTTHRPLKRSSAVRYTLGLLEKYGGPAVFLGRFIAFARAVIPGLAGMSGLRYRTFLFWNVLGATMWGVGYTLLGYVVGLSFQRILTQIGLWSLAVVVVLVAGVAVFEVRRRRREKRRIESELTVLDGGEGVTPATSGTTGTATHDDPTSETSTYETSTSGSSTSGPATYVDGPPPSHEADAGPMVT
jgi:membrane-associated protein